MPPEQITPISAGAGPAQDQYAAAATLYYLLTGRRVYDFAGLAALARFVPEILTEEPGGRIRFRRADIPGRPGRGHS